MFEVRIKKSAIKELSKLPAKESIRISIQINELKDDPRPHGTIKLKKTKNEYRVRVGNYRVLYTIEDAILIVEVFKIGDRKGVY